MSEYTPRSLERLGTGELARRYLINERIRKHWRILAMKATLGLVDTQGLLSVCFHEILGDVPEDADLDRTLEELVTKLEAMDGDHTDILAMFGKEPRAIDLG